MVISIIWPSVGSLIYGKKKRAPKKLSSLAVNFTAEKNIMRKWLTGFFFSDQKRKVSWQSKPVKMLLDAGKKVMIA